jgi:hypothetical protein
VAKEMSYSDFSLKQIKEKLKLEIVENQDLFSAIIELPVSDLLSATLKYNIPLAMAVGTEKARSELIISNILLEVRKILNNQVSLFSGVIFDVDKERGLAGFCDFIISQSPEQFYLSAPIITVVEAKNENIVGGLGQCVAEMYASSLFNEKEGLQLPAVFGAVTTGNAWKFLKLEQNTVYIDIKDYYIDNVSKIVGILVEMAKLNT